MPCLCGCPLKRLSARRITPFCSISPRGFCPAETHQPVGMQRGHVTTVGYAFTGRRLHCAQKGGASPHISQDFCCACESYTISGTLLARRLRRVITRCQPAACAKHLLWRNLLRLTTKPDEISGLVPGKEGIVVAIFLGKSRLFAFKPRKTSPQCGDTEIAGHSLGFEDCKRFFTN